MSPPDIGQARRAPSQIERPQSSESLDRRFRQRAETLPNGTTVCPHCRAVRIDRGAYNRIKEGGWTIPRNLEIVEIHKQEGFARKHPTVAMPGDAKLASLNGRGYYSRSKMLPRSVGNAIRAPVRTGTDEAQEGSGETVRPSHRRHDRPPPPSGGQEGGARTAGGHSPYQQHAQAGGIRKQRGYSKSLHDAIRRPVSPTGIPAEDDSPPPRSQRPRSQHVDPPELHGSHQQRAQRIHGGGIHKQLPRRAEDGIACMSCNHEIRKQAQRKIGFESVRGQRVEVLSRRVSPAPRRDPGQPWRAGEVRKAPHKLKKMVAKLSPQDRIRLRSRQVLRKYQ